MSHHPYWHAVLSTDFCTEDGEPWPCLAWREAHPRCACTHAGVNHSSATGICWYGPCACAKFDPHPPGIPARFDERYDPSPEPIDRRIK